MIRFMVQRAITTPASAGDRRQHQRLGEQLTNHPPSAGAHRQSNGDLAPPAHGFGQQQVRHVRARDGEDEHHDDRENAQDWGEDGWRTKRRLPRRHQADAAAVVGVAILLLQLPHDRLGLGLRLLARNARLQPDQRVEPAVAALLDAIAASELAHHHHRRPRRRRQPEERADEAFGRHADHGHRRVVHAHLTSDDRRISGESALPVGMTQDDHRMTARRLVVLSGEQPAQRRLDAQDVEVVARTPARPTRVRPGRRRRCSSSCRLARRSRPASSDRGSRGSSGTTRSGGALLDWSWPESGSGRARPRRGWAERARPAPT